jgi:hypothetical protein
VPCFQTNLGCVCEHGLPLTLSFSVLIDQSIDQIYFSDGSKILLKVPPVDIRDQFEQKRLWNGAKLDHFCQKKQQNILTKQYLTSVH